MRYILAFDCGTTAVKAVCIECDTEKLVGNGKADCKIWKPHPGWAEQDAEDMWQAVCRASRQCVASIDPGDVEGIIFSAPWKHIIPVDEHGVPLRKSIIWMDARAKDQAEVLNSRMGRFVGTGQEYWPRLMWLKEHGPEVWSRARYILGINSYFKFRATGTFSTECSDDFVHTPNPAVQAHYDRVLSAAGLTEDLEKFPQSRPSSDCVGSLTAEAAKEMGLSEGVPVFAGFSDLTAISVGCGCVKEGMMHIYLGTSSWLAEVQRDRMENYASLYFTQDSKHEGAVFSLQTGARAYEWIIEQFYGHEYQTMGEKVFDYVNREVAEIAAGSQGLIATHWLNGELPPLAKNAKAVFFNIVEQHDRRYFARAMLESLCYTHRWSLEKVRAHHGTLPKEIRAVGGGATSDVWMQMLADVLQIPVRVPKNPRYVGAMGAYYCALIGLGRLPAYGAIPDEGSRLFEPQAKNAEVYEKMSGVYQDLYPALKGLYDRLDGYFY